MHDLTKHEELILLSICRLKDNAYGVTIRDDLKRITGKALNYGSMCNTLYVLLRKGMLNSTESAPKSEQGGRRKVLYSLTKQGKKALGYAYNVHEQSWNGIKDIILDNE